MINLALITIAALIGYWFVQDDIKDDDTTWTVVMMNLVGIVCSVVIMVAFLHYMGAL